MAVRGVIALAERFGQGPVALASICREQLQYMTKIFSALVRADIVTPVRGRDGGYMLSREPSLISLLDVIEAVEGPLALNYCQHTPAKCDNLECKVRPVWTALQQTIHERLNTVKLSDCVGKAAPVMPGL